MSYLLSAGIFLIQTAFGFFIALFLVRTMLIAVGAPFNEPVCRFVYSLTNRIVTPLRQVIPRWRRIELASVLIAWLLAMLELVLLLSLVGAHLGVAGVLWHALIDTLDWIILIEFAAILVYCLLSFIPSARYDSNFRLLAQFIDPVVRPFRRLLPPLGGMDFSCWFASIALILLRMLVIAPLTDLSQHL
jgi:YggT family protein